MTPLDLFYSYAHEDESLRDELAGHLRILERRGVIRSWVDRDIVPGEDWSREIAAALQQADLVLLLVSSDFINSDYIWGVELDTAMQRHRDGKLTVIPVMIRACDIEGAPFAGLQGLPTDLRAVTSWPNRDEAWTNVAKGIRRASDSLRNRSADEPFTAPPEPTPTTPSPPSPEPPLAQSPQDPPLGRSGYSSGVASVFRWAMERIGGFLGPGGVTQLPGGQVPEPTPPYDVGTGQVPADEELDVAGAPLDDALTGVLNSSVERLASAAEARGGSITESAARATALDLVDLPDQKRILWVDDRPSNNRREIETLAGLQIEVVTVTGTGDAMARLKEDSEPFDLVLSDWWRPDEELQGAPSAAVVLLRALRSDGFNLPVLLYHGTFKANEREKLRRMALAEGAAGEATRPDELFAMIAAQLGAGDQSVENE